MHGEHVTVDVITGGRRGTVILLFAEVVGHVEGPLGGAAGCAGPGVQAGDVSGDPYQEPVPETRWGGRVGVEAGHRETLGGFGRTEPGQLR